MAKKLRDDEVIEGLADIPGWTFEPKRPSIVRDFKFNNFAEAWTFMSACALWAEKRDHHPEWSNVYNEVSVVLTTHDVDGVSALDLNYARFMNSLFDKD